MQDPIAETSNARGWASGSQILLREVGPGEVWSLRPVTVVQDTPELVALYLAPGTPCKHPEFEQAQALGLFSPEQARAIRAEGERVIQHAMAQDGIFAGGWFDWSPASTWTIPEIPPGWNLR